MGPVAVVIPPPALKRAAGEGPDGARVVPRWCYTGLPPWAHQLLRPFLIGGASAGSGPLKRGTVRNSSATIDCHRSPAARTWSPHSASAHVAAEQLALPPTTARPPCPHAPPLQQHSPASSACTCAGGTAIAPGTCGARFQAQAKSGQTSKRRGLSPELRTLMRIYIMLPMLGSGHILLIILSLI